VSRIRVLVVDDSVVARRIVVQSLADDPQIEVVGTAANGRIALTLVGQLKPDVVTMDMEMPVMDGIETVRAMRRRGDRCRIIMFSVISAHDAKQKTILVRMVVSGVVPLRLVPDKNRERQVLPSGRKRSKA